MGKIGAVVLAAGEGKRMRSSLPKVLHPLCGRPMLAYILEAAAALAEQVIVVIGHGAAAVREACGPRWQYVMQEEQLGTGHALAQALPLLTGDGRLLVLCGDTPLLDRHCLAKLLAEHRGNAATILTAVPPDPTGYGRVIRRKAGGPVERIVEERDATGEEKRVTEINTGTYCFEMAPLKRLLPLLSADNAQKEYYLTDLIAMLVQEGRRVGAFCLDDYRIGLGVNDRVQLAEATAVMRERINVELMRQGVTMIDPAAVYIDAGVKIGPDTEIWPQTVVRGHTVVGSGCSLGPSVELKDARLGDKVVVRWSLVEGSVLEEGAQIGPYAHIPPGCRIGPKVRVAGGSLWPDSSAFPGTPPASPSQDKQRRGRK